MIPLGRLFAHLSPGSFEYVGCDPETPIGSVRTDSRQVEPGDAFLALPGHRADGHRFVAAAVAAGAQVVLLERGRIAPPSHPHVVFDDTRAAHPDIAADAHGRPGDRLRLAAVTGTNGKTTTAHLVSAMLTAAGWGHGRLGTTGNWLVDHEAPAPLTTAFPLELQGMLADIERRGGRAAVMEASSHALVQGRLRPLQFTAVGMTSFSQDHLDYHGSMEAYFEAKALLVEHHTTSHGIAVAAVDDHPQAAAFLARAAARGLRVLRASRGAEPTAEIVAESVRFDPDRTRARVHTPVGALRLDSPLIAAFNVDNALVAIGLALGLGLERDAIEAGLSRSCGAPGRLERVSTGTPDEPRVLVDYAHTPQAVERALAAARSICSGTLTIVLGCGGDRDRSKRPRMGEIAARHADRFVATSDNPRSESPSAILTDLLEGVPTAFRERVISEVDRATAIRRAVLDAGVGDVVLIAGKGHEDYQIVGDVKQHFDDREHARAALAARIPTPE